MGKEWKFVDTFAGIGGFRLGIESACRKLGLKCRCVASVEINRHSRKTYRRNFGDMPLEDMTKIVPNFI